MEEEEKDELLKALKTIKSECNKHLRQCKTCPMSNSNGECEVTENIPCDWRLEKRVVYFGSGG